MNGLFQTINRLKILMDYTKLNRIKVRVFFEKNI